MTKCYANKNQQVSAIGISTDIRQWSNLVPRVFSFSNMAGHSDLVVPAFWVSPYPIFIRLCFGYPQWHRKIVPFRPECWTAVHSLYFEPKRKMSNLFKTFWRYPCATFFVNAILQLNTFRITTTSFCIGYVTINLVWAKHSYPSL